MPTQWISFSVLAAVSILLAIGLIPSSTANRASMLFGRLTVVVSTLFFFLSMVTAFQLAVSGPIDSIVAETVSPIPISFGIYIDALAVVMMLMISFIGSVIARYSLTYLLGESNQGRFFRWMSFTLGTTLLMVISRNLIMFTAAWMMTSFGLHQLLMHYSDRNWAIWAARKKFLISRLGDLMLIMVLLLSYRCFGTTEYVEVYASARAIHDGTQAANPDCALIGLFLVLGAMTKSAQFPFHSWLPDTMETPTPVSALMHAGVINAGGFLIIRLSPLVTLSPMALHILTLIGIVTAILGSVVMMTQTSIKRSLAFSTIAQMGFMMLQCGLGAFSSALLHIVAHSAYKAHAFLSCGSVLDAARRLNSQSEPSWPSIRNLVAFLGAAAAALGIVLGAFQFSGIGALAKSGGIIQVLVLTLALIQLLGPGFSSGVLASSIRGIFISILVVTAYVTAYKFFEPVANGSIYRRIDSPSVVDAVLMTIACAGFAMTFVLQIMGRFFAHLRWIRSLYVHAMNGFYVDIPARRITAAFYRQSAPVQ